MNYSEKDSFGLILTRCSGFQALKAKTILREGKLSIKGIICRFKITSSLVFFFPISRVFGTVLCWVLRSRAWHFLCLVLVPLCVLTRADQQNCTWPYSLVRWSRRVSYMYVWSLQVSQDPCVSFGTRIGIYRYLIVHAKSVWLLLCNKVGYKTIPSLLYFIGSDEQCWDKNWCLLPGIRAVV